MDFDLELVSGEDNNPDPLFNSIISAMNSMKEATADKIYQKIQREGVTNYSKPQVDRALASALKYGIFEVKNNRYRVRDDVLDDVDTVYCKMQRKREQTPGRIQEGDKHMGKRLDPEKDNLRFRKIEDPDTEECPQCGRTKRPSVEKRELNVKSEKTEKRKLNKSNAVKSGKENKKDPPKIEKMNEEEDDDDDYEIDEDEELEAREEEDEDEFETELKPIESKRKWRSSGDSDQKRSKIPKLSNVDNGKDAFGSNSFGGAGRFPREGKYDSTDESELESLSFLSDDEQSFTSHNSKFKGIAQRVGGGGGGKFRLGSECGDAPEPRGPGTGTGSDSKDSSVFLKAGTESEASTESAGPSKLKLDKKYYGDLKRARDQPEETYFATAKLYEGDDSGSKTNWIDYSGDQQGAIIQSDNVLTIEPMDLMTFKGPEHTSYIS